MSWHGVLGHDELVEQFRRALARRRLASSFLFVGPEGIGKRTFALKLAQALLCQARPEEALDPCGSCPACVQVAAQTHPDLEVVAKPKDKSFLPLELLIGDKEHRMRTGLCHSIALKPFMGGRKVAVIDDADYLNAEGANCLLKTLEEPPPRSVLILIGTSAAKQLPTIRSRCQLIRFRALPAEAVAELLVAQQVVDDPAEAGRLARHAEGSVQRAKELADPELWAFRSQLYAAVGRARAGQRAAGQGGAGIRQRGGQGGRRRAASGCGSWWRLPPSSTAQLLQGPDAAADDPELGRWLGRAMDAGPDAGDRGRVPGPLPGGGRADRPQRQPGHLPGIVAGRPGGAAPAGPDDRAAGTVRRAAGTIDVGRRLSPWPQR